MSEHVAHAPLRLPSVASRVPYQKALRINVAVEKEAERNVVHMVGEVVTLEEEIQSTFGAQADRLRDSRIHRHVWIRVQQMAIDWWQPQRSPQTVDDLELSIDVAAAHGGRKTRRAVELDR